MKRIFVMSVMVLLAGGATAQVNLNKAKQSLGAAVSKPLSTADIGAGLKEALTNGVSKGTDALSQADGYLKNPDVKIPFPPEMKKVEDKLRQVGMGGEVDKFIMSMNRAAEDAAQEAKPIFVTAIKEMSIQDAGAILKGEDDAATKYLSRTTTPQLHDKFKPIIQNSLNKTNATKHYADLINAYNKLPMVQKVNPDLENYATSKAIEGLFVMVAKEEKNIRQDPAARTSDLLKKVFGGI